MGGLSLTGRLDQIAEALVLTDLADFAGLAGLHTQLEEFVDAAVEAGFDPRGVDAARQATVALASIILEESEAPEQALAQVTEIVSQLQRIAGGQGGSGGAHLGVALPVNVDERILNDFLARRGGVMEQLEELVLSLEQGEPPSELPRLLHTLKGEAALLGLKEVEQVCHAAEDYLGRVEPNQAVDLLLEAKDWLTRRLDSYAGRGAKPLHLDQLLDRLHAPWADAREAGQADPPIDYSNLDRTLAPEFCSEATEHLDASDAHLLTLEANPESADAINAVFRAFHTLKGGAGLIGAREIGEIAHEAESLLDRARKGKLRLAGRVMDITFETVDALKRMVAGMRTFLASGRSPRREANHDSLIRRLRQATQGQPIDAAPTAARREGPGTDRALERPAASSVGAGHVQVKETVRVDADRLDRLVDMIGELVIAETMVSRSPEVAALNSAALAQRLGRLDKVTRELQELTTSLRMVSLRSTFQKMARLVRDLARKTGKQVEFVTSGEETELDKTVVDGISDPLVHMVRNAVDHGVEPDPATRIARGKSPLAKVELRAFHKGGNIYIQLEDDGRGLDQDAIVAKGRERGLLREGETPTEREIWNLIFAPGISTAKHLTEVSGRGVGMDVVKKSIDTLRGQVEIRSEPGRGTLFTIRLPLTLAIIDGMVIRVGHERYIIPTLSVLRSLRPERGQISTVFGRGEMLNLPDGPLPLLRLSRLFDVPAAKRDPTTGLVVVVEDEARPMGLLVDELLGRQEIVIKNLGQTMGRLPGIAGSAIMTDGSVGLIVDVGGLVRMAEGAGALSGGT